MPPTKAAKKTAPTKAAPADDADAERAERLAAFYKTTSSYTLKDVLRSRINVAVYNPRTITENAKGRLRGSLDKTGFVAPPFVWNERTGTLVSGHQRLAWLDKQARKAKLGDDWTVKDVACIDVDEATERALNYALNNPQSQGQFDLAKLGEMFATPDFSLDIAGLEAKDVPKLVGGMENAAELMPREMLDVLDRLNDESERYDKVVETTTSYPDAYLCFVFEHKTATDAAMTAAGLDASTWLHPGTLFEELLARLAAYRAKHGDLD